MTCQCCAMRCSVSHRMDGMSCRNCRKVKERTWNECMKELRKGTNNWAYECENASKGETGKEREPVLIFRVSKPNVVTQSS